MLLQDALLGEVAAAGHAHAIDRRQLRVEPIRGECADDVPVARGTEGDALALTVDDEPDGDRLHATGRLRLAADLLPQHLRHGVAVEPIDDAAGLLRLDELHVEVTRVRDRLADGLWRDLVEDHALDGDLGSQDLQQVPRDGLALAVLVRREKELVGILERLLQVADRLLLGLVDDVVGLEVVVDVDRQLGPGLLPDRLGKLGRLRREVADMTDRGHDRVVRAEIAGDLLRLCGRLDDHQGLVCHVLASPISRQGGIRHCSGGV